MIQNSPRPVVCQHDCEPSVGTEPPDTELIRSQEIHGGLAADAHGNKTYDIPSKITLAHHLPSKVGISTASPVRKPS